MPNKRHCERCCNHMDEYEKGHTPDGFAVQRIYGKFGGKPGEIQDKCTNRCKAAGRTAEHNEQDS